MYNVYILCTCINQKCAGEGGGGGKRQILMSNPPRFQQCNFTLFFQVFTFFGHYIFKIRHHLIEVHAIMHVIVHDQRPTRTKI